MRTHLPLVSRTFTVLMISIILLLAGCSGEKSKTIIYNAEKLYHQAEKLRQKAGIKPGLDNTDIYQQLKTAYFAATDYCWANIDSLAVETFPDERKNLQSIGFMATNRLTQIYSAEKKYDSVIFVISQLLHFTNLEGIELLTARFNLARAYQSKGDLTDAVNIYHSLLDTFYPPVTDKNEIIAMVLNLPLQIIRTYQTIDNDSLANIESNTAEKYYQRLKTDWPGSAIENAALSNLARLYYDQARWDDAINQLNKLTDSSGRVDVEAAMMTAGILINGKKQYDRAIGIFDDLLGRVTDTTLIPVILLRKGIALFEKKDYQGCRKIMSEINDDYGYFYKQDPTPQKYIALSFDRLGDWNRAENEYKWLMDNYSVTGPAFDAYLTVAEHYKTVNNKELSDSWFQRADEFYNMMAGRYSGTAVEASAISYLAESARRREKWELAAKYLEQLYNRYPSTDHGRRALINAASIYREKFHNEAHADSLIDLLKRELIPLDEGKNINNMTENIN
ncbi:MAG: tetratricopeptide repeat protein [Candidatus Zixiibacteriota bacterium]